MGNYDFDEIIDRDGTNCLKYDFKKERGIPEDAMSLWVADMDFQTAPEIIDSLKSVVAHGIYGYSDVKIDFSEIVSKWYRDHFGFDSDPRWIVRTPGVVFALANAVRAFSNPGDAILIQQPVYYPFSGVIRENGRRMVSNDLVYEDGRYRMDLADFEQKIIDNDIHLFILCSPHNPVGRVWTKDELEAVAEICLRHDVFVVADEIHCDFVWGENKHTVFASLSEEIAQNCMVCTAPSKTFNLASLQLSNIFIPNAEKRKKFHEEVYSTGYDEMNIFGLTAARAAYTKGEPWLLALKEYIRDNIRFMKEYLEKNMPEVKMVETQGTYLTWVDCSGLGLTDRELNRRIVHEAKLWLDAGNIFGTTGEQFERFNVACPRKTLEAALERFVTIRG